MSIDENTLTVEWRGLTLHRRDDLEEWRKARYELFDDYEPALTACEWRTEIPGTSEGDGVEYARLLFEAGLWSASWADRCHRFTTTPEGAMAECDAVCVAQAKDKLAEVEMLLAGHPEQAGILDAAALRAHAARMSAFVQWVREAAARARSEARGRGESRVLVHCMLSGTVAQHQVFRDLSLDWFERLKDRL